MSEVVTPLTPLPSGETFTADEDGAFVITEAHTHADILRFVVADLGLETTTLLLANLDHDNSPST